MFKILVDGLAPSEAAELIMDGLDGDQLEQVFNPNLSWVTYN